MNIVFATGLPHLVGNKDRDASFTRLCEAMGHDRKGPDCAFTEKEPNWAWAGRMWSWGVEQGDCCTHFLTLQDDITIAPGFWRALHAMVAAKPNVIIGLQTVHPLARFLAEEGIRWITTPDGLVGTGYVVPIPILREFLEWRRTALTDGSIEAINEDTLLGIFAMATGKRIHHPIPTIIDHDTSIASTYGNDDHTNRRSLVTWQAMPATNYEEGWDNEPVHVGRMYSVSPLIARKHLKTCRVDDFNGWMRDNGQPVVRHLNALRRARGTVMPEARVLVCTPIRGGISPHYAQSIWNMQRDEELDLSSPYEVYDVQQWQEDVVRVRGRFVNYFLHETDATHLFFVDSDIHYAPIVLRGMLQAKKDFVAAPYPRRDHVNWQRVRELQDLPAEAAAYRYSVIPLHEGKEWRPGEDGCIEVRNIPLGCALLSRAGLERMQAHYRPELGFDDNLPWLHGQSVPSVALFQLMFRDGNLRSEDYSYCERWRDIGGQVWMYLGPGAPVSHHGELLYQGALESFGLKRA